MSQHILKYSSDVLRSLNVKSGTLSKVSSELSKRINLFKINAKGSTIRPFRRGSRAGIQVKTFHTRLPDIRTGVNVSNLKAVPLEPMLHRVPKQILFSTVNTRSVRNKTGSLVEHVINSDVDICAITETWLTAKDGVVRAALKPEGYSFQDHPREKDRAGGGTGIMYRSNIDVTKVTAANLNSFEYSEWLIKLLNLHLRLFIVYRVPYSESHPVPMGVFFEEFSCLLEDFINYTEPIILAGDFNIHVDSIDNADSVKFLDLLESTGLVQHVTTSTHESGHILDNIITRSCDKLVVSEIDVSNYISDHAFVHCKLSHPVVPLQVKQITYRKLKNIDLTVFLDDLGKSNLFSQASEGLEDLVSQYNKTLVDLLNVHAPSATKTVVIRPIAPWFGDKQKQLKIEKRKAERLWRSTKSAEHRELYKKCRNAFSNSVNAAVCKYYSDVIEENAHDLRKQFGIVKSLMDKKSENPLPKCQNDNILANNFADFFVQKVSKIRAIVDSVPVDVEPEFYLNQTPPSVLFDEFKPLTDDDVLQLIKQSSSATCDLDPLPTKLIKSCISILLPVIANIVNSSLQSGEFPESWKCALVQPLLKKPGLDKILSNYRPVSNLQFVSKLTEKAVVAQFLDHIAQNCPLPVFQSAYRINHSTETALAKVQSDILCRMDKGEVVLLVMLDLSAAFDTVDHQILLKQLQMDFGVEGTVLNWFRSYLTNRCETVKINHAVSDKHSLSCGVPQGSCLGPILFTAYASTLFKITEKHSVSAHSYADDCQLYVSFRPSGNACNSAVKALEDCIEDIRKWMFTFKLKINDSKTEFMIIGTRQQLSKVQIDSIRVGDDDIVPVTSVRNLGVIFDKNSSMNDHVSKLCKIGYYQLYSIRQIRSYLTEENTRLLVQAFIFSHLDYCNSLLFGITKYQLDKLQRLQNSAARLIMDTPRFTSISPVLHELHWLKVEYRIQYKILMLVYRGINNLAPAYITDFLQPVFCSHYSLRSNDSNELEPLKTRCTTLGDRSFAAAGPELWNDLPQFIRNATSLNTFKKLLKTHLFRKCYP